MRINPIEFKPAVKGKSDFFSWQLFRWLRKKPEYNRVYLGTFNRSTGHDPKNPILYIGRMDDNAFLGNVLARICTSGQKLESWAYCMSGHHVDEWEDVTEKFWSDYREKGVCAIHGDKAHDWVTSEKERACTHCKKREYKTVVMLPKTVWMDKAG